MIRGFVLCLLLVESSYASFGTASCSSGFSPVPFCATATCTSTEKSYSKPMPATYAWGEDTDLPIDTATNAAALRVLRWKCSCDKYDDGTAADGDCTFQQYKLNSDGTTSTSETEFVQALAYYKFNVWAPPPRSGRNASATQARIYDLWSDHQATRAADMQDTTTEYRAQMEKKAKLRRSLTLLQESSKSGNGVGWGATGQWSATVASGDVIAPPVHARRLLGPGATRRRRRWALLSGATTRRRRWALLPGASLGYDASKWVTGWQFGLPEECKARGGYGSSIGVTSCCPNDDPYLHTLRIGLNAEVFASVVTVGDARDSNDNPLDVSADTMKVLPGGQPFELAAYWQVSDIDGSNYWQAPFMYQGSNGNMYLSAGRRRAATQEGVTATGDGRRRRGVFLSTDSCTHSSTPIVQQRRRNSYNGDTSELHHRKSVPDAAKSMVLALGVSALDGFAYAAPCFHDIWVSSVRTAFDTTDLTAIEVSMDDEYFGGVTGRRTTNMREIDGFGNWILDWGFPSWGSGYKMVKKGAYIKGVEFRVVDTSTLQLLWTTEGASCKSQLSWVFNICKSCGCTSANGAERSLVDMSLSHDMLAPTHQACGGLFQKVDRAFRGYMSGIRAAILAMKQVCCTDWSSNVVSSIAGADLCSNGNAAINGGIPGWAHPLLDGSSRITASLNNADSQTGSTISLCPAITAEFRKGFVCDGPHPNPTPAPTMGQTSAVSFNLIHTGHSDITSVHKAKLELACTKHVYVEKWTLTDSSDSGSMKNAWDAAIDKGWLDWLSDKPRFGGKIVCAEGTHGGTTYHSAYPDAAREAFAMVMGQHYFSPKVTETATSTSGKYVAFEIGCGGDTLELDQYASYLHEEDYGVDRWPYMVPKDPDGNSLKVNGVFKLGAMKMDGGESDMGTGWRLHQHGDDTAQTRIDSGLQYNRRRGNTPGFLPTWSDAPNNNYGKYRPNNSGTSSTCCPPKGLNLNTYTKMYLPVPESGDWRSEPAGLSVPCFRGMYGETQTCRSKLYLHISECNGCDCMSDGNTVLVNVDTRHGLETANAACKPWFTQVDSAIRSYIAIIRADISKTKLDACLAARKL